ncbi:MAG: aminotransferase class V-fold PLP-dependent enzyme [Sphingobacteriia bacterium]|nr:MAG: aminotransferase class V-fold PLP-dependent enzyme [Sphingobacteriia bacterium]
MNTSSLAHQFLLRKDICFLNFGSFGACPQPIFDAYQAYQRELEADPVYFITQSGPAYIKAAREALGQYLNAAADDLVLVTNPSYAVNIVAKSFALSPGDEILTTNLEYGACDRTWQYYCQKAGAVYKRQAIRLPLESEQGFLSDFFAGVSSRTKLIFVSHLTSATGLRLPVEAICQKANALGIPCFVDGAHAPGQLPLDLSGLGAVIYTGACHKWMMTPKGSSFLFVDKKIQDQFDPLVVSWGYQALFPSASRFQDYHQMQGTRDFSAFCTLPKALQFMQENNWPAVAKACRQLAHAHAPALAHQLGSHLLAPLTDEFFGQLVSIPIRLNKISPEALHDDFYHRFRIQIPVMRQGNDVYLRYSIQVFNTAADLAQLAAAIDTLMKENTILPLD